MRAYGYVRISRDEDGKKESIETQRDVVIDFAKENNIELIEVFSDNNVSGYTFDRPELSRLRELIDEGMVDALLAKDLSRIGRHNAKTLLFLDYLDENNVRLLLKSDNYDSETDDDSIMGIKTWYNEMYLKDLSKKIKINIKQKQKAGIYMSSHFGFIKDSEDKKNVLIDEEAAEVVKLIFRLYIEGYGCTKIARYLNENSYDTPATYKFKKYNVKQKEAERSKNLWYAGSIKRLLKTEVYTGTLHCGVSKLTRMKGKRIKAPLEEQFIHEGFLPQIISKDDYEAVQSLFRLRDTQKVRAKSEKIHKYSGMMVCSDCGSKFYARLKTNEDGSKRVVYVCKGYHLYGTDYCSSHNIQERELDNVIFSEIQRLMDDSVLKLDSVDKHLEDKLKKKKDYEKAIEKQKAKIHSKKEEIKNYSRQLAKQLISEEIFEEMVAEAKKELEKCEKQLVEMNDMAEYNKNEKENLLKSIDILNEIIQGNALSNYHISLLIEKIMISEDKEKSKRFKPKLNVSVTWNT